MPKTKKPITKKRPVKKGSRRGFTIIEITVIIVIIGILATMLIFAVGSWRKKTAQTEVKSDLSSVSAAMENARNFNNGYPTSLPTGFKESPNVEVTYVSGDASGYCVEGVSTAAPVIYFIDTRTGSNEPKIGTCAGGELPAGMDYASDGPWLKLSFGAGSQTCGWHSDRQVYCWGRNDLGQLGNGTTANSSAPSPIVNAGLFNNTKVSTIDTGESSTCAVVDEKAYCWGDNSNGKLGNGSTVDSSSPVAVNTAGVLAGKKVTWVGVGYNSACALADGAVYCWGTGTLGQLGNGTSTGTQTTPVAVDTSGVLAGKTISQLYVGTYHSCALADNAVYCWGSNAYGQLGNNTMTSSNVPVAVDMSGVLAGKTIASLNRGSSSHTCVIASDKPYCWGINSTGQLGNGFTGSAYNSSAPVAVTATGALSGKKATLVSTGSGYSCTVADAKAYCWGSNSSGQLGDGTTTARSTPVAVSTTGALNNKYVISLTLGNDPKTCAMTLGQVYCWGDGTNGMLGSNIASSLLAVPVTNP